MASDETFDHYRNDLSSYTIHWEHNITDYVDLTPLEICEIVGDECVENIVCESKRKSIVRSHLRC